jgi:hypothetical protein
MSQDQKMIINLRRIASSQTSILIMLLAATSVIGSQILISAPLNVAYGETGIGKDVFKVVVSIFGVTKDVGDIAAAVTVNGNSKVKSFDVDGMNSQTADPTSSPDVGVIEFVATFPNTQVNVGDQYKACVLTLNTMDKYCQEGNNSPAKRPEFADITMDKAIESESVEKNSKVKDESHMSSD